MDKVVRRTAQAVRQAQRKARIQAEKDARLARKDYFRNLAQRQRIFIDARKNQRNEFRENWFKGPIAPLRDAGDRTGVYGAAGLAVYHQPVIPKPDRRKFITIAAGDYVVIVKGRDKGLIDKVATVSVETESVTLHNLNKYELEIPEPLIDAQSPYATQNLPTPLPLDHVRLVMPLYDPKTGKTQDTIIESVRAAGPRQERPVGSPLPSEV
ncbi:hypothetical protein KEM56_004895 [Ascosphaera pollenicola]|nr:hypothetical protein KEM56_004895 [Ascosphaera pollenicola]